MKKSILMAFAMLFSIYVNAQLPYKITAPKIEVRADSLKLMGNSVVISDKAGNQIINVNGIDRTPGRVLTTDANGVGRFVTPTIQASQVNSDWNSATGLSQILNKPTIPSISGLATNSSVDTKLSNYVSKIVPDTTTALKTLTNGINVTSGSESILNVNTNGTYISNVAQTTPTRKAALETRLILTNPITRVGVENSNSTITLDTLATSIFPLEAKISTITVNNNSTLSPSIVGVIGAAVVGNRRAAYTGTVESGRFITTTSSGSSGQPNTQNWTNTALNAGMIGVNSYIGINGGTGVLGTISNASCVASQISCGSNNLLISNGQNYASLNSSSIANRITNLRGYVSEELTRGVNNTNLLLGTSTSPTGNWNIFSSSSYPNNLGAANTSVGSLKIVNTPNTSSAPTDVLVWNNATGLVEKTSPSNFYSGGGGTVTSNINNGLGILGGGSLTVDRTLLVDTTVIKSKAGSLIDYNILKNASITNAGNIATNTTNITTNTNNINTANTNITNLQNRNINTGLGILGGGNLTADRTLRVDTTVIKSKASSLIDYNILKALSNSIQDANFLSGAGIRGGGTIRSVIDGSEGILIFTADTSFLKSKAGALIDYNILKAGLQAISTATFTGSATLDFPNTPAFTSSDLQFTLTGVSAGDIVVLGTPVISSVANTCFTAIASGTNQVNIRFNNYSSVSVNPLSGIFKVKVLK